MAFVATRPGAINGAADKVALNLKVFGGQTLALLDQKLILFPTMTVKQALAGAKVAQFPTFGDATANYHEAGEDILTETSPETGNYLSDIQVAEHTIAADRIAQSSVFLPNLDSMLNQWDHRSAFSSKLAVAMAEKVEDILFRVIAKGSGGGQGTDVEGTKLTGWPGGQNEHNSGAAMDGEDVYDGVWQFAENCDVANLDRDGRYGATTTALYYELLRHNLVASTNVQISTMLNKDFTGGVPGGLERPAVDGVWVANTFVMPSNSVPSAAIGGTDSYSPGATANNSYDDVDMTKTFGLFCWTKDAIGTVVVADPTLDVNWIPERLGHLVTLYQSMGHGVLRPEGCYTKRVTD